MLLHPPSEEIKKRINKELYQDPDKTAEDIKYLKEWLRKQPHLPQNIDDIIIERFLYVSKYSLEKCKKLLDNHYTFRTYLPRYFSDVDPTSEYMRDASRLYYKIVLPKCTPEGYRVAMLGLLDPDESKYIAETLLKKDIMLILSYTRMESCFGVIIIYDMRGYTATHMKKLATVINDFAILSKDTLPMRIKQVHVIYVSQFVKVFIQALSPLLTQKIRERIYVHTSDLESLYLHIPRDILPENIGGQCGTIEEINESWQNMFEDSKDWITEEYRKKSDESKRPTESKRSDMFGMEGSFRSISID